MEKNTNSKLISPIMVLRKLGTALLLLASLLISPSPSSAFPQIIYKGYRTCGSCHVTASGGTALTDYGRALLSDLMSTFSVDNEAREFIRYDSPYVDYKFRLQTLHLPEYNIPMFADAELSLKLGIVSFNHQYGVYSRDLFPESRQHFLSLAPFKKLIIRLGHFMPSLGLLTNDHSLPIKRLTGLSRGSESYTAEIWLWQKKFGQAFLSWSINEFIIETNESNTYTRRTKYPHTFRGRLSVFPSKKSEVGCNIMAEDQSRLYGFFAKYSPGLSLYSMFEINQAVDLERSASHLRLGGYVTNGLDLYVTRDTDIEAVYNVGADWMIRPGFQFSLLVSEESFMVRTNIFR